MTTVTDSQPGDATASGPSPPQRLTLKSLVARHKRASAAVIALLVVLAALAIGSAVSGSGRQALSDAATCSQWGAATSAQKIAYAHVYIGEYEAVPDTAPYAGAVKASIDRACVRAAYLGEADDVSVLAAMRHAY